jgi:hypothetical protein
MKSLTDIVSEIFILGVGITRPKERQRQFAAYYISACLAFAMLVVAGFLLLLVARF